MVNKRYVIILIFSFLIALVNSIYLFKSNYLGIKEDYEKNLKLYEVIVYSLGNIRYNLAAYFWIRTEYFIHYSGLVTINQLPEIVYYAKLITILNPNFIDAYDFGAYQLAFFLDLPKEGLEFIKEGIKNNPNEYKLYFTTAMIYSQKLKDYNESYKYFLKTIDLVNKNKVKLDNADNLKLYRFLAHSAYQLKKYKEAYIYYNESLKYTENKEASKNTQLYQEILKNLYK
ncbi:MAG: tetratricopeptide repeat protein [bacterium]